MRTVCSSTRYYSLLGSEAVRKFREFERRLAQQGEALNIAVSGDYNTDSEVYESCNVRWVRYEAWEDRYLLFRRKFDEARGIDPKVARESDKLFNIHCMIAKEGNISAALCLNVWKKNREKNLDESYIMHLLSCIKQPDAYAIAAEYIRLATETVASGGTVVELGHWAVSKESRGSIRSALLVYSLVPLLHKMISVRMMGLVNCSSRSATSIVRKFISGDCISQVGCASPSFYHPVFRAQLRFTFYDIVAQL